MELSEKVCNRKIVILFTMIMLDYFLTYVGINILGCIGEGNQLLVGLFEMSFINSLVIRLVQASIIVLLSRVIYKYGNKYFNGYIAFGIGVNTVVMILHIIWMTLYLIN